MPVRLRNLVGLGTLIVLAGTAGCQDGDTPSAPDPSDRAPALAAAASGLRDAAIDLHDTYFAFEVTTTQSVDAGTVGGVSASSLVEADGGGQNETAYIETGYGSDGQLRFDLYSDGYTDPRLPDPPSLVRTVGNTVYLYDLGVLSATYDFNDFLEGAGLPGGDLASGTPAGTIYDPPGGGGGGGGGTCIVDCEQQTMALDGERTLTRQPRSDVLQITTTGGGGAGLASVRAAGAAPTLQTVRTYRRRSVPVTGEAAAPAPGGEAMSREWVLESLERTLRLPTPHGGKTVRTRRSFRYLAGHVNRGRDLQRTRALDTHPRPARAASLQRGAAPAPAAASTASLSTSACDPSTYNSVRTVDAGAPGVIYQHGFCSGAGTWEAMRQRVPETHRVGLEQTYSLDGIATIESQVTDLAGRVSARGVGGNVVVAHSQGGLVARRLGQRRPDLVSGVVTIGTPHQGALIAYNPPYVIADRLTGALGYYCFGNLMCQLSLAVTGSVAAGYVTRGIGDHIPAAGDDQPNSPFLQTLNGQSQPQSEAFRRASISVSNPPRWALFRLLGDNATDRSRLFNNDPLQGRTYVRNAQRVYDAARVAQFLAMALRWWVTDYGYGWGCSQSGYTSYWEPCYDQYGYYNRWWLASYWLYVADALDYIGGTVQWVMDEVDAAWDDMTTGGTGYSDSFVQYPSQLYPDVAGTFPPRRFELLNAQEAHSGETASKPVLDQLRLALDVAGLPRR